MQNEIVQIKENQLPQCLDFIHLCFKSVAEKFGFTKENCPGHTSFMPLEKLQNFWNWGFLMYGIFSEQGQLEGYISLCKVPDKEGVWSIHNLCVHPDLRYKGYGKLLLDFAKAKTKELSGQILFVDFIDEHTELKNWYIKNGFDFIGTQKYEHLPFTVGMATYKIE